MQHHSQQCVLYGLLSGNHFLLSNTFLCLASFCADRLHEVGPLSISKVIVTVVSSCSHDWTGKLNAYHNHFLLSIIFLCLASFCTDRLHEIGDLVDSQN